MPADITLPIDERERTEFPPYFPCLVDGPDAANSAADTKDAGSHASMVEQGGVAATSVVMAVATKASAFVLFASMTIPMRSIS